MAASSSEINRRQVVAAIAKDTDLSQADVAKVFESFYALAKKNLSKGTNVHLPAGKSGSILRFEKRHRAARNGRNPHTGEKMRIAAADYTGVKMLSGGKNLV